jgi:nicotinate-nucleotide adenylyltransferase
MDDLPSALAKGIEVLRIADGNDPGKLVAWELRDQAGVGSALYLMPDLHEEISATDIRAAISGEGSAEGVLAPAVLRYIEERGLYR